MILVGSRALAYWLNKPELVKDNSDWDLITERPMPSTNKCRIECHYDLNDADVSHYTTSSTIILNGVVIPVCSLKGLMLIRRSHLHRPQKFQRNMWLFNQVNWPMMKLELDDFDKEFLKTRTRLTKEKFGDRVPSLNQTNEDFFDDYVTKHFDHDYVHEYVAYYDKPLYTRLKYDYDLAKCEKKLWNKLTFEDKIKCVLEECYVIGLERFIVPKLLNKQSHQPFRFAVVSALNKVCTTLTSGWFRDFAIDNYMKILDNIDCTKMELFIKNNME